MPQIKTKAAKHVDEAYRLATLLLPNNSDYDRCGLVDRILRLASAYRKIRLA